MHYDKITDTDQNSSENEPIGLIESRPFGKRFLGAAGAIFTAASCRSEALLSVVDLRNKFPEPFDFADHVANTMWTFGIASIAMMKMKKRMCEPENTFQYGIARSNSIEFASEKEFQKRRGRLMGVTAALIVGLNIYSETVASAQFDGIDIAYGVVGGAIAYAAQKPDYLDHEVTKVIANQSGNAGMQSRYQQLTKDRRSRRTRG
jgi:hypothetical protein